jgi:hypothetical protein
MKLQYFAFLFLLLLIFSCDKHRVKKHSGIYKCNVHSSGWLMGSGSFDTNFVYDIEVSHREHVINVLDLSVPIDSLYKDKKECICHEGVYDHTFYKIEFIGDYMELTTIRQGSSHYFKTVYTGRKQ